MEESTKISIDDLSKLDIRIGRIVSAERVPDADKLIKFMVDVGLKPSEDGSPLGRPDTGLADRPEGGLGEERDIRQILSGIALHYPDPTVLEGKQVPVLVNLAPRVIRGLESNGMILYAVGETQLTTLEPNDEVPPGTRVR